MSTARPYFSASIEDLTDIVDDPSEHEDVCRELAFRRGSKRVRKLAKELGCQWKVSPTNASQTGEPNPFMVTQIVIDPASDAAEVL